MAHTHTGSHAHARTGKWITLFDGRLLGSIPTFLAAINPLSLSQLHIAFGMGAGRRELSARDLHSVPRKVPLLSLLAQIWKPGSLGAGRLCCLSTGLFPTHTWPQQASWRSGGEVMTHSWEGRSISALLSGSSCHLRAARSPNLGCTL